MMNKWRYPLEDAGVHFRSYRSNGQRLVDISFSAVSSDSSDGNDANTGYAKSSVTCDPCVPDEECGGGDFSPSGESEECGGGDFSPSGESQHRICLDAGPCPPPAKSGFAGRCPTPLGGVKFTPNETRSAGLSFDKNGNTEETA